MNSIALPAEKRWRIELADASSHRSQPPGLHGDLSTAGAMSGLPFRLLADAPAVSDLSTGTELTAAQLFNAKSIRYGRADRSSYP